VAGFSTVQDKVPAELRRHAQFAGEGKVNEVGEWRFRFRAPEDSNRIITVHVFLFNLYPMRAG